MWKRKSTGGKNSWKTWGKGRRKKKKEKKEKTCKFWQLKQRKSAKKQKELSSHHWLYPVISQGKKIWSYQSGTILESNGNYTPTSCICKNYRETLYKIASTLFMLFCAYIWDTSLKSQDSSWVMSLQYKYEEINIRHQDIIIFFLFFFFFFFFFFLL